MSGHTQCNDCGKCRVIGYEDWCSDCGYWSCERGPDCADVLDTERDTYAAARASLAFLIDNPDKTVSVDAYKAQIRGAQKAVRDAYKGMPTVGTR